ncbi:amino acid ABC transporter substrate-binding protein [Streptosporangiaceae bacterium NEAU-GS5]|nr:amino acid ABC transporter substrate-binding protein [Streptosporangiaceae bacterium NEAU-GS5]
MADLRGAVERLIRRPLFWRKDPQLPVVLVTGHDAADTARELVRPFRDDLPSAAVEDGAYGSIPALVAALAGSAGQLGRPVGGSFLPAPRFPLAQFVLWVREQNERPEEAGRPWPPDPQSHEGYQLFKRRLKDRRQAKTGGVRVAADFFIGRAAVTWVPVGTIAFLIAKGPVDIVGVFPWLIGAAVALVGILGQGLASVRGSLFYGWFRRQPYVRRRFWERLPQYALRLAGASADEVEKLLVHALCKDLRQAYARWPFPWPSWGRGLYCLLLLHVRDPGGANARLLRLLEETCAETGLLAPLLVVAAVPEDAAAMLPGAPPGDLERLADGGFRRWRRAAKRRLGALRLTAAAADDRAFASSYQPRLWPSRLRALGYWFVVLLVVPALLGSLAWRTLQDRNAHCGGLSSAERIGEECVGVVNAAEAAPDGLFSQEIAAIVKRIDQNNQYAIESGRYVSVIMFGEYSIKRLGEDDTRFAGAVSELTAVAEYQGTISSTPRLRILIANAGDDYGQGQRAAELVTELAEQDPHVIGVVGMARSVTGVERAVGRFDAAKLPTVATTATADDLGIVGGNPSPYYFHIGPTNFREAALAARFAARTLKAKTAVIVQDGTRDDIYTNNLAEDFATALQTEHITVGPPVPYGLSQGGLSSAAGKACTRGADIFLYAGRAPEFVDFLKALEGGSACGSGVLKVLAGDDVIKVVSDHRAEIAAMHQVEVYYAALASREVWQDSGVKPTGFVNGLLAGRLATASDDNLILTYDAVNVIYRAADQAYRPGDQLPSRGDVLYWLSRTARASAWDGSSGVIDFGSGERHDPVGKVVAIMKVALDSAKQARSQPMVRCGALDANEPPGDDPRCAGLPDAPKVVP